MPDFPQTALLEDFDYSPSDENPLSHNGLWGSYFTRPPCRKSGSAAFPTVEFVVNGSYWTSDAFTGDAEAWICLGGGGLGAANESWRVALWKDDPDLMYGYSSGYGGGIGEFYFFRRYDGGGSFTDISTGAIDNNTPDKLGIRLTPTTVEQWREISSVWTLVQSAADTTYRGTFFISIEVEEQGGINELSIGCMGGGIVNRQHIYRVLRAHPGVPA